ncbi:acyl-CoA dehydrogenase family protein [Nocardia macrotermitis]|uniref:Caffeyl-CoA reductase-Etf complex subunit CarC n=1 Tax=Nocardia macrotermitis TaxID=2585198 RepID=A0A7K0CZ83_9NOCA|nr:acyl-CoA dehydrogenase family protein [Nocardia macrotermitis]MQY18750.1 Caffeyl-CoA reductase-Etf complex subunit CarC [Nocardia macrotermitis]
MSGNAVEFADIHDELRAVARDVLASPDTVELTGGRLADLGWLGLEIPDESGGAGASFAETAIVLEEFGRAAAGGYLGAALGAGTCALVADVAGRDELLRELAAGEAITAVALVAAADDCSGSSPFRLREGSGGLLLSGRAEFVPDVTSADRVLLLADDPDGVPVIVAAEVDALACTAQPVLDETRTFGLVTADDVAVQDDSVWRFAGNPDAAVRRLRDRAALSIGCDSLGLAAAMLDATTEYVAVREQFGRPVGSFQAVKHACADMLVRLTIARHLVADAVRQSVEDTPDAWVAVSMAKSYACAAAVEIAGKAMQLHGGFGYTWESGIHRYHKRAMLNRALFGSPAAHRRRLAERYSITTPEELPAPNPR